MIDFACKTFNIENIIKCSLGLTKSEYKILGFFIDNPENYFTPINLNSLTIQLYEDTTDKQYRCQNNDNSFEFELTVLNRNV